MRGQLLSQLPWFVSAAAKLPGVRRIALLGSITTNKPNPKDIDFLIEVEDEADLTPLAKLSRQLSGKTRQLKNQGADIFLTNPEGHYIGRTCKWKECGRGIRLRCEALNCGQRQYLSDDPLKLSDQTVRSALELWPTLEKRSNLPEDLERVLRQLES